MSGPSQHVAVYEAGTWYTIDPGSYLAGLYVNDVEIDPVGTVWIGTSGGLFHYVPTDVHSPR